MGVFKRVAKSKAVYLARKGARKVGQAIKRRYYNKKTGVKLGNVVKDVMMLKKVINAEKKRYNMIGQSLGFGQLYNATAGGLYCQDITPIPTQGVTYDGREGSSIKVCSFHAQFQIQQQTASTSPIKYKIMLVQVLGTPQTASTVPYSMYNYNDFVSGGGTIVDYNSQLNPDNFGKFRILKTWRGKIASDSLSSQIMLQTISFGGKMNHHIRYNKNSTTVQNGQMVLILMADNGNSGTTASILTSVSNTGANTGLLASFSWNWYYYDN